MCVAYAYYAHHTRIRDGLLGMCGIPDEDCDPAARHDEHEDDQQGAQEPGEGEM